MKFTIGEFSRQVGVSIHTLRYYEKEGLIAPQRLDNGRRVYTDQDITWMAFIKRLKDTNMPIKEIQKYAKLRETGDSTFEERMELLVHHREALVGEIAALQEHLCNLDMKIDYYREAIASRDTMSAAL